MPCRPPRLPLARFSMVGFLGLAACVAPETVEPPPPPAPIPVIAPHPPTTTDWRDIPLTAGDWRYAPVPTGSAALFSRAGMTPDFTVRCDRASRTVSLERSGDSMPGATMAITTSAGNRALGTALSAGPPPVTAARLAATDGFLDRMAFSRGRFVIAVTGTPRLVLPAWPEFARVVEDCRG